MNNEKIDGNLMRRISHREFEERFLGGDTRMETLTFESVKQEVGMYLDLLNISFPSAAFICFGVGNLSFEDLTPEQQIDIKNHLKEIYEMRMEL